MRLLSITFFLYLLFTSCMASFGFQPGGRIALLGDSMTWIGGDSCEKEKGWSHYLAQAYPKSQIDVYARSGATWTNAKGTKGDTKSYSEVIDDENVLFNQAQRLIDAASLNPSATPSLIVLYAGANDAWFEKRRPGLYEEKKVPAGSLKQCRPSDFTTLASSVELVCRKLTEAFPNADLILVTPVEMAQTSPARINKVGDTIEKVGRRLDIPVFRGDKKVAIRSIEEKKPKHKYTSDGAHTNPQGARLIAEGIITFIKENIKSNN